MAEATPKVEPIDGASLGLSAILKTLRTMKQSRTPLLVDTVLVNILTLVRNNHKTGASDREILQNTRHDMETLIQHVAEYTTGLPGIADPDLVFYLPNYKAIPEFHRRSSNAATQKAMDKLVEPLAKEMDLRQPGQYGSIKYQDRLDVHETMVGWRELPHTELLRTLTKIHEKAVRRSQRRTILISHSPIELHLQNHLREFWLLENFTGKLRTPASFGEKVFKIPQMPFNRHTHLLLGDSYYVKPLVRRQDRQRVIDMAKQRRWQYQTAKAILSDIEKLGILPIEMITTVPL